MYIIIKFVLKGSPYILCCSMDFSASRKFLVCNEDTFHELT